MIWAKTDAGRAEMQAKALIKERAQRNLLLLIDGQKSEEMLLANVAGITANDFAALEGMGLIEPVAAPSGRSTPKAAAPAPPAAPAEPVELDYAQFTQTLTQLISKELGLRGFTLTLAVEKAGTIQELQDVAKRTIDQIRDRKGEPAAEQARRALYGG
ncbi:hypothetical protein [Piscinibacter sp. XHJ-5]|uniref:hypothetical protein n=1 Tax=Piscinibacter sp. XHJ-5 TaxID=3037797 RepID=UPI002452E412|nr:hypothetical protein [Piscinibacter sp. XHJ-5]